MSILLGAATPAQGVPAHAPPPPPATNLRDRATAAWREKAAADERKRREREEAARRRHAEALGFRLWHWLRIAADPDGPLVEIDGLHFEIHWDDGEWHLSLVQLCPHCGTILERWMLGYDSEHLQRAGAEKAVLAELGKALLRYDERVRDRGDARCKQCPPKQITAGRP